MSAPFLLQLLFLFTIVVGVLGAPTQNFSVQKSTLSQRLVLEKYGGLEAYVAFKGSTDSSSMTSAWLLFIPTSPSNTSYILCTYIFVVSTQQPDLRTQGAVVWMANRIHPVSGDFTLTLFQSSGNLVLLDGDESVAWSSHFPRSDKQGAGVSVSMDLVADSSTLLPLGTLLLSVANTTLWQSSDTPSHTLMTLQFFKPGMSLISWASPSNPSQGLYSLVMQMGGLALYYNAFLPPQPYWIWSYYGLNDTFGFAHTCSNEVWALMDPKGGLALGNMSGSPVASPNSTFPADFCSAQNSSVSKEILFDDYGNRGKGDATFLMLQDDGNLLAYTLGSPWTPVLDLFSDDHCVLPNKCGPYGVCSAPSNCECPWNDDGSFPQTFPSNSAQGCPPIHSFTCHDQATSKQKFLQLRGVDYFANKYSSPLNFSTQETCTDACLQSCSCLAAFWHVHTSSCFHIVDQMASLQGSLNNSYLAFLKVEDVKPDSYTTRIIAGVASGVVALLMILCLSAVLIYRKRFYPNPELEEEDPLWNSVPGTPVRYSYTDLDSITNGFSKILGKGGFGAVYEGLLQDGTTRVAVKRLESLRQGAKEFRAEVVIMGGIHHHNLVGLIGFCAQGSHRLLVYEYMANGSLDQWLYNSSSHENALNWSQRLRIALGAARGLAYLHGECNDTIIHLDIKPQNILLDADFEAKVSDFGLSRIMGRDETHVVTTMRGTPGYFAPEWMTEGGVISTKCDVFSYGKLLLEIVGGRRNLEPSLAETEKLYFPSWLYHQVAAKEGGGANLKEMARVENEKEMGQAELVMKIAFLCVLENPHQRPSMDTVVCMLEGRVPQLYDLQLPDLFQGLHFVLRVPAPHLAQTRIDEALALIYPPAASSSALKLASQAASGGTMQSLHVSAR